LPPTPPVVPPLFPLADRRNRVSAYTDALKEELEGHKAAGREDRAAEVTAELKRASAAEAKAEKATRAPEVEES
jgi:hypothetical protein